MGSAAKNSKTQFDEQDMLLPVVDYMHENYNRYISISELAEIFYMHPTYLIRKFKSLYGVPPLVYFSNIKIKKAIDLLSSTNLTIKEVASKLGMDDASYFSRWFKKHIGFSPLEYRKNLKSR